ncbi:mCG142604 [Mus musculus]|nr:mCG142604 [Mus musculus]
MLTCAVGGSSRRLAQLTQSLMRDFQDRIRDPFKWFRENLFLCTQEMLTIS